MAPPRKGIRKAKGKDKGGGKRKKVTTAGQGVPVAAPSPPVTSSSGRAGLSAPTTLTLPNGHAQIPKDILDRREEVVSAVTASTKPSDTWFESTRPGKDADDQRKIDLVDYVRRDLFPGWKFFTDPRQLVFDASETSLVRHICLGMHLKRDYWPDWWELNKSELVTTLNRKRTDVTAMIKKAFIGTLAEGTCCTTRRFTNIAVAFLPCVRPAKAVRRGKKEIPKAFGHS
jgi:hypothetical protein